MKNFAVVFAVLLCCSFCALSQEIEQDLSHFTRVVASPRIRKFERRTPSGTDDTRRKSMYSGAIVTAYVTYRELDLLEIRGEQELTCNDPIDSEQFTLRAYGENEVTLSSLRTDFFKAKLYGENRLSIRKGKATEQQYSLYGENRIDTRALRSKYTSANTFGENSLKVSCREEMRIHAFGEPEIRVDGGAQISSRVVIGNASIERY